MPTPQRTENHQIDTLAVRRLISTLNENWVVRDLSERDYGVDLMVEYFDGTKTTGKTAYFQVKGKGSKITILKDGTVSFYKFPVKTLLYAEQFPEPFFLIYLSKLKGEPIYFIWLQHHCRVVLDRDYPGWRNQEEINLSLPSENDLLTSEERLLKVASKNVMMKMSMQFLSDYHFWDHHIDELIENENIDLRAACIDSAKKFRSYEQFFQDLDLTPSVYENLDFAQAISDLTAIENVHADHEIRESLRLFRGAVDDATREILSAPSLEEFIYENTGDLGY
ncbi:DUF4365 domain-containing protein [Paraburkholderia terrae]|uniref:DUF4365 domain-containing protein n=1 Tax=Paraburkholderia terrae TaxID=311230 RepID=UPI00296B33E3|nr:DUF4365 domain-containing protein [Paraburkholderia terrae]MDW3656989.1 DUF4365 domain-containing protein [Paraburkholderia terrae]